MAAQEEDYRFAFPHSCVLCQAVISQAFTYGSPTNPINNLCPVQHQDSGLNAGVLGLVLPKDGPKKGTPLTGIKTRLNQIESVRKIRGNRKTPFAGSY